MGLLSPDTPPSAERRARAPFVLKARELGWVNGQNMLVEKRWAEGQIDRLPQLAADLINSKVDVILALGGFAAVAAKRATRTIPVVFSSSSSVAGTASVPLPSQRTTARCGAMSSPARFKLRNSLA